MPDLSEFQTQNLILLIGTNPLPNYVAAQILLKPGGHLYLVYTDETNEITERLAAKLGLAMGINTTKIHVDEAKSDNIFEQVQRCAEGLHDVGLNYTGGTKMMAVHAYRAVEQVCPKAVFSYLDARSLKMIIEKKRQLQQEIPVALYIELDIQTLLQLHGYTLKHDSIQKAMYPDICKTLAKIGTKWRNWCDNNLRSGPGTSLKKKTELRAVSLDDVEEINWQGCCTLFELAIKWKKKEDEVAKWLDGKWLEHYTLWALQQIASECQMHQAWMNIEAIKKNDNKDRSFELDVVAMRGYQLFAISCTTGYKKSPLKSKLFEAYVRARQMGGDEARVGLVSCAPKDNPDSNPSSIQSEIEEAWDAQGKVRVFGAEHLPDLPTYLKDWFDSQLQ